MEKKRKNMKMIHVDDDEFGGDFNRIEHRQAARWKLRNE